MIGPIDFDPMGARQTRPEMLSEIQKAIVIECDAIREMLLAKNRAYGNSALDPLRVFSRADPVEQLKVRIDDKLSRIARGQDGGEDPTLDLIGYLILLRIALRLAKGGAGDGKDMAGGV